MSAGWLQYAASAVVTTVAVLLISVGGALLLLEGGYRLAGWARRQLHRGEL